jgi:hypothetical protein
MTSARRTGPALEAMYQFMLWLVPAVEKFPRSQKFPLGDRIQAAALDVLERLIEATYTRARRQHLEEANLGVEKLRFLIRLAKDLKHLDMARYEHAARSLDEIGRLIGGWRKADDAATPTTRTRCCLAPTTSWASCPRGGGVRDHRERRLASRPVARH